MRARVIAAIAVAIVISSCEKKAEGQTVAVVNGEEITSAELNAELASANVPENADKEAVRARVLQTLIDRKLLAQHAREEGIDTSPEFLNRQRRMTEDLLISMLAARQVDTAQLPSAGEVSRFQSSRPGMFAQREMWNLEQIRFKMPEDPRVREQMGAAKSMDQLVKVLTDNKIAFARGKNRLDTAVIPPALYGVLATVDPGEPFIIPVGDQAVASVIVGREPSKIEGEQARPIAVSGIRREQGAKFMQDRLKALRESAKIEYKEGFAPPPDKASAGAAPANGAPANN